MKSLVIADNPSRESHIGCYLKNLGECDITADVPGAMDAFLRALENKHPYQLVCLDMNAADRLGLSAIRAIRAMERQYGIGPQHHAEIVLTVDEEKKQGTLLEYPAAASGTPATDACGEGRAWMSTISSPCNHRDMGQPGYFEAVTPMPDYRLLVRMGTGSVIEFDFRTRLNTVRFAALRNKELFQSVQTDGERLIFRRAGGMTISIGAAEFMDLVLVNRADAQGARNRFD